MTDIALTHSLINELAGTVCRCGSKKIARQTFCYACYKRLPIKLRQDLYLRVGAGYEEAYQKSVRVLAA